MQRLTEVWTRVICALFHSRAGWPVGQVYYCRTCWLAWPVPWAKGYVARPLWRVKARHGSRRSFRWNMQLARFGRGAE